MKEAYRSILVISGGLLLIGLTFGLGAVSRPALAQPPRPTITPQPPAATPAHDHDGGKDNGAPSPTGRITGTVIDLTTGAPAPDITVAVGDILVTTDADGNYDRNGLASGNYLVALVLKAEQGIPAQEPVLVELAPGATVVQHLAFRSQPPTGLPAQAPARPSTLPKTGRPEGAAWVWIALGIGLIIGGAVLQRTTDN